MSARKFYIALTLWMFGFSIMHSREIRTEIHVNFRVNSVVVDTAYLDNAARIREISSFLQTINQSRKIELKQVYFCGAASLEGSDELNNRLAKGRLEALKTIVRKQIDIPDDIIIYDDSYIPWDYLKEQVENSDLRYRDEILEILSEEPILIPHHHPGLHMDHRILELKLIARGDAWIELYQLFFSHMRNACVVFITGPKGETDEDSDHSVLRPDSMESLSSYLSPDINTTWGGQKLHLKTNALNLALGIANLAVEFDLAPHWSLALPLSYSAWNYFSPTVKFRCLNFQPEARYWVDEYNIGFFSGFHLGVSSYNFAFDGEHRYQDRNGTTPAWGGGVSLGYRIPIGYTRRWHMEFSLGAGVYALHYDVFKNTPNVKLGALVETKRSTYVGLDQASVSFTYAFDLKKKGGRR